MKRRSFLRLLATAAPAAVAFPQIVRAETLGLGGGIAPSNRINLGLIGAGGQGLAVATGFMNLPAAQLLAVADVDAGHRQEAKERADKRNTDRMAKGDYKGCDTYVDYLELIARPDIDAVIIGTPDHWHALQLVHAARAGKHVYCEKPVANTVTEGRAMVAAVERSGIVCQIGNQQRSIGDFRRAINLVRGGYLGKIKAVKVGLPGGGALAAKPPSAPPDPAVFDFERWLGPAATQPYRSLGREHLHFNWRWTYDFGGGILSDWICHHYDIAILALGLEGVDVAEVRECQAQFPQRPPEQRATPPTYSFEALYPDGTIISVSNQHRNGIVFEGSEATLFVTRGQLESSNPALERVAIPAHRQIYGTEGGTHHSNFLDCIRHGGRVRSPIAEVSRITNVAHLVNAAFRTDRSRLVWDAASATAFGAPDATRLLHHVYRAPYALTA
jgi:predicted dehydrogenase